MPPYLSLAIWVPIVAGLLALAVGRDRDAATVRWIALVGAVAGFLVTLPLYAQFDVSTGAMQFVEFTEWVPRFDIHYHLGVDGLSVWFVLLTAFIARSADPHAEPAVDADDEDARRRRLRVPHPVARQ